MGCRESHSGSFLTFISLAVTSIFSRFLYAKCPALCGLLFLVGGSALLPSKALGTNTLQQLNPNQVIGVIERVLLDPQQPDKPQPVGIRLLKPLKLQPGTVLQAIRIRSGQNATVAELRVTSSQGKRAVAQLTRMTRGVSHTVLADYPFLMAGDFVQFSPVTVKARYRVVKPIDLRFDKLYQDPRFQPMSYQLSDAGRRLLEDTLKGYVANRQSLLIVEGHTDNVGSWRMNQLESQQRAEVVKRFAVDALGIDPERVVAVGQGEMEPIDQSNVPGARERNRRIVIKVQPLTSPSH